MIWLTLIVDLIGLLITWLAGRALTEAQRTKFNYLISRMNELKAALVAQGCNPEGGPPTEKTMSNVMTADALTAMGVPAEHHATATEAAALGIDISTIIALVADWGPRVWVVVQDVIAFAKGSHSQAEWLAFFFAELAKLKPAS